MFRKLFFIITLVSAVNAVPQGTRIKRCDAFPGFAGSSVFYYPLGVYEEPGPVLAEFHFHFGTAYLRCYFNESGDLIARCNGEFTHDVGERVEMKVERVTDGRIVASGTGTYNENPFTSMAECKQWER